MVQMDGKIINDFYNLTLQQTDGGTKVGPIGLLSKRHTWATTDSVCKTEKAILLHFIFHIHSLVYVCVGGLCVCMVASTLSYVCTLHGTRVGRAEDNLWE